MYVNPSGSADTFVPDLTPLTTLPVLNGLIINVALDYTGQVITLLTTNGYVYVSNNQGKSWTNPSAPFTPYPYNSRALAMSQYSSGKYMSVAMQYTLSTYYSMNQGKYFNATTAGLSSYSWGGWNNLAASYSGQYVVGSMEQGVFLSSDYGMSWQYIMSVNSNNAYVSITPMGDLVCKVDTYSNQITLYQVTNVPSPAPTTFRPTISSAPTLTRSPTNSPSPNPTLLPTPAPLTTGWVWMASYLSTDCSGAIGIIPDAYRLGSCFVGPDFSYMYSCSKSQSKCINPSYHFFIVNR
jgi:hypothetical protein